eukprot:8794079-Pyramimonas_sp.AAC.1
MQRGATTTAHLSGELRALALAGQAAMTKGCHVIVALLAYLGAGFLFAVWRERERGLRAELYARIYRA